MFSYILLLTPFVTIFCLTFFLEALKLYARNYWASKKIKKIAVTPLQCGVYTPGDFNFNFDLSSYNQLSFWKSTTNQLYRRLLYDKNTVLSKLSLFKLMSEACVYVCWNKEKNAVPVDRICAQVQNHQKIEYLDPVV